MNTELDRDLKAIVSTFFAVNVHNLLAEPSRLEALGQLAKIPPERVPAIREALLKAKSTGLAS